MAVAGNPTRIVVFGGIGSGKSTFAAVLRELGATIIEADQIGHEILRSDGPAFAEVSRRWPTVVVDGEVDRKALAGIVFSDPEQLADLEEISHPLIAAEIQRRAQAAGDEVVVAELPLVRNIVGADWTWVLVEAPRQARIDRAVDRGAALEDVVARMDAQPEGPEWHGRADWVVPNTGSVEDLTAAAHEFWAAISSV